MGRFDKFADLEFEVAGCVDLGLGFLRLEVVVEWGDDVAVDLVKGRSDRTGDRLGEGAMYVVSPEARVSSALASLGKRALPSFRSSSCVGFSFSE